jgi:hypothetical protein
MQPGAVASIGVKPKGPKFLPAVRMKASLERFDPDAI